MSSTISERLTAIRARAKEYSEASRIAEDRNQYQHILGELAPLARTLEVIGISRALLLKESIELPDPEPPGELTAKEVGTLRSAFADDSGVIIDSAETRSRKKLLARVAAIASAWHNQTLQAWSEFVGQLTPDLDGEVLLILQGVPDLSRSVQEAREGLEDLRKASAQLPARAADVDLVRSIADRTRVVLGSIGGGDMPQEVIRFLRAAGVGGADLGQLTDTVRVWLEKHEIVGRFAVTMRSSSTDRHHDRS